jgi:hypothetical protein
MISDSAARNEHGGSAPRRAWHAALLLAAASVITGLAVSLGLLAALGPSPERRASPQDIPAFHGSYR